MELLDFTEFEPFNSLREKIGTDQLGYFELFDPAVHLTGSERSGLETSGLLRPFPAIKILPDNTLAIKTSRVLIYNPDESWYRARREYPTFHVAKCSLLDEMAKEQPDLEYLVTTRVAEDYELLKIRPSRDVSVASHGCVCATTFARINCATVITMNFSNRKRGYSQKVLKGVEPLRIFF